MGKKFIYVDRGRITENGNNGTQHPVFVVRDGDSKQYASGVRLFDENGKLIAELVYRPDHNENIGAKAWIETTAPIELL